MGLRAGSTCLKCLLLLAIVLAGGARAQAGNYPDKPVRLILDAAAGGAIDTNLRIIAESLSKKWAQQVVIGQSMAKVAPYSSSFASAAMLSDCIPRACLWLTLTNDPPRAV